MIWAKIFGIGSAIMSTLFAMVLFAYLPKVSRVGDLTESGAGLELGEWQISVGIFLTALLLFAILAVASLGIRFTTSLTIVSWLALCGVAGAVWSLHSVRAKTGVLNIHGHGLTYDEWWASVIPWTIGLVLVGLCAGSSLVHWLVERRRESNRTQQPGAAPDGGPGTPVGNTGASDGPPSVD
jgi:hypothetical protein